MSPLAEHALALPISKKLGSFAETSGLLAQLQNHVSIELVDHSSITGAALVT
ncbi:MAG TPA: hypothetical protein VHY56_11535 [Candidatus Binataceae bacterium]|nr:hypothetical protein [Candidatus Binataceae bacterium]